MNKSKPQPAHDFLERFAIELESATDKTAVIGRYTKLLNGGTLMAKENLGKSRILDLIEHAVHRFSRCPRVKIGHTCRGADCDARCPKSKRRR